MRLCLLAMLWMWPWLARAADGASLYVQRCAGCHQAQGQGLAAQYPPLTGMEPWFASDEGRRYIARVVVHGLTGPIVVHGQTYNALMLTFRRRLQDEDLIAVLRYVAETLNHPAPGYVPMTPEMMVAARAASGLDADNLALRAQLPAR